MSLAGSSKPCLDASTTPYTDFLNRQIGRDDVLLAFFLNPRIDNYEVPYLSEAQRVSIQIRWLQLHGVSDIGRAIIELDDFRLRRRAFEINNSIWLLRSSISGFWDQARHFVPCIGELAVRLSRTPSNIVMVERSFSNLKVIHSSIRNRLKPDRVRKLLYVYMNSRVLERDTAESMISDDDVELARIELEDEIVAIGGPLGP